MMRSFSSCRGAKSPPHSQAIQVQLKKSRPNSFTVKLSLSSRKVNEQSLGILLLKELKNLLDFLFLMYFYIL